MTTHISSHSLRPNILAELCKPLELKLDPREKGGQIRVRIRVKCLNTDLAEFNGVPKKLEESILVKGNKGSMSKNVN